MKTGGVNHLYVLNGAPGVLVEVPTTKNKAISSYGISFFGERARLRAAELEVVDTLIATLGGTATTDAVRRFVRANIERSVFQIRQARSIQFGHYRLWAGKVGNEQIAHIEPE